MHLVSATVSLKTMKMRLELMPLTDKECPHCDEPVHTDGLIEGYHSLGCGMPFEESESNVDRRSFTGFGIDQCPSCGSRRIEHATYQKRGAGPNEINDHVSRLKCDDCGWKGDE